MTIAQVSRSTVARERVHQTLALRLGAALAIEQEALELDAGGGAVADLDHFIVLSGVAVLNGVVLLRAKMCAEAATMNNRRG